MENDLIDALDELSKLDVDTRAWREQAERILVGSERLMQIVAHRVARQPGIVFTAGNDRDDVVQRVRDVHWRMLQDVGSDRTFPLPFETWEAALFVRARSKVVEWARTSEVTGLSGSSGPVRRTHGLHELRDRFEADLGISLSAEEIVDTYNDRVRSDVGEERKHAAPAKKEDLESPVTLAKGMDLAYLPSEESVEQLVVDRLSSEVTMQLVEETIGEASAVDPTLGAIARAWFSASSHDATLPAAEVAKIVGVSAAKVRKDLGRIRAIFAVRLAVGGSSDDTSLAIARTIYEAQRSDDRLGRVAELRFSRWAERDLVTAAEIAERLDRPEAAITRAIAEIDELLERHLAVDDTDRDG